MTFARFVPFFVCVIFTSLFGVQAKSENNFAVPSGKFKMISGSSKSYCAIDFENMLHCWGISLNMPSDLGPVKMVSVGDSTACAIDFQNELRCWSDTNYFGTTDIPAGLGKVVDVSTVGEGVCAAKDNGEAWCWGGLNDFCFFRALPDMGFIKNVAAALDIGCFLNSENHLSCLASRQSPPLRMDLPKDLGEVVKIQFSESPHLCAMTVAGDLKCFQVAIDSSLIPPPANLGKIKDFAQGLGITCAVTEADDLRCWKSSLSDLPVRLPDFSDKVKAVAAGFTSGCAILIDSTLRCWGDLQ